jgi:hypothetical protein
MDKEGSVEQNKLNATELDPTAEWPATHNDSISPPVTKPYRTVCSVCCKWNVCATVCNQLPALSLPFGFSCKQTVTELWRPPQEMHNPGE